MQEQAPGAPKGVRMARGPDGSKGFAPGRGRALPPSPASSTPPEAPGSVSKLIQYFICGRLALPDKVTMEDLLLHCEQIEEQTCIGPACGHARCSAIRTGMYHLLLNSVLQNSLFYLLCSFEALVKLQRPAMRITTSSPPLRVL